MTGSAMNPVLTISALPAAISAAGRVSSMARSTSTADGSWNAPTRFLPAAVLIPVLPPTAASTMASSVVGTCTTRTPRIQVAATKPARSVAAPPPEGDDHVAAGEPDLAADLPAEPGDGERLALLGVGHLDPVRVDARRRRARRGPARPASASGGWCTSSTVRAPSPRTVAASRARTPRPTSTG